VRRRRPRGPGAGRRPRRPAASGLPGEPGGRASRRRGRSPGRHRLMVSGHPARGRPSAPARTRPRRARTAPVWPVAGRRRGRPGPRPRPDRGEAGPHRRRTRRAARHDEHRPVTESGLWVAAGGRWRGANPRVAAGRSAGGRRCSAVQGGDRVGGGRRGARRPRRHSGAGRGQGPVDQAQPASSRNCFGAASPKRLPSLRPRRSPTPRPSAPHRNRPALGGQRATGVHFRHPSVRNERRLPGPAQPAALVRARSQAHQASTPSPVRLLAWITSAFGLTSARLARSGEVEVEVGSRSIC